MDRVATYMIVAAANQTPKNLGGRPSNRLIWWSGWNFTEAQPLRSHRSLRSCEEDWQVDLVVVLRTIRGRIVHPLRLPIKSSWRSPSMQLSTTTRMLFTSVLNGCLPSWPNFVFVHSLSLLPFSPFALKHRERKKNIFEMALSGGPRQILAALPVVVAQLSIISTDVRKHPVPTAQETPQPHRRENPCLCGLPLR